jgi:aspartate ammonia-lyase
MSSTYRQESDLLGTRDVPAAALYGIHTLRALESFPLSGRRVHRGLVHAFGVVKQACARTNHELGWWDEPKFSAIDTACREMSEGRLDEHVLVDALQGGAGTSTNMNVNEVLANRALQILAQPLGDYNVVSPLDDINLHQSTNDTYPTALRVAAIWALKELERKVVLLLETFQRKELEMASIVKIGRTQLQDAVLMTLGREMGAYAEALARDRWRIYKCEERLRVVNLGGTAIGTGLGAPRQYIFRVVEQLRNLTGLGMARAENLVDATQNSDALVEVSGIVRTLAVNLYKIATDMRLLSSGPKGGFGEIRLPPRQAGSSIMPGKVNPVIPEAVTQAAIAVMGHDQMILHAVGAGNLELSQFLPLVADSLLTSLDLLAAACDMFARFCIAGIEADVERCEQHVHSGTATLTALVEHVGYHAATELATAARESGKSIRQLVIERNLMDAAKFDELMSSEQVMRLGRNEVRLPDPHAVRVHEI